MIGKMSSHQLCKSWITLVLYSKRALSGRLWQGAPPALRHRDGRRQVRLGHLSENHRFRTYLEALPRPLITIASLIDTQRFAPPDRSATNLPNPIRLQTPPPIDVSHAQLPSQTDYFCVILSVTGP